MNNKLLGQNMEKIKYAPNMYLSNRVDIFSMFSCLLLTPYLLDLPLADHDHFQKWYFPSLTAFQERSGELPF